MQMMQASKFLSTMHQSISLLHAPTAEQGQCKTSFSVPHSLEQLHMLPISQRDCNCRTPLGGNTSAGGTGVCAGRGGGEVACTAVKRFREVRSCTTSVAPRLYVMVLY